MFRCSICKKPVESGHVLHDDCFQELKAQIETLKEEVKEIDSNSASKDKEYKSTLVAYERAIHGDCSLCTKENCVMPCRCINGSGFKFDIKRFAEKGIAK